MTIHQELSKLRKEEVRPHLSGTHTQKYTNWHRQARAEGFNWQKLEVLALLEEPTSPRKQDIIFKAGTKLLREYQGKTHQVLATSPFISCTSDCRDGGVRPESWIIK